MLEGQRVLRFADCAANGGTGHERPAGLRAGRPVRHQPRELDRPRDRDRARDGHHLGLPDFYSRYSAYSDWNLMACDYSQHMTIFSKQELGGSCPSSCSPARRVDVETGRRSTTTPADRVADAAATYTLSAATATRTSTTARPTRPKLPRRLVIDPRRCGPRHRLPTSGGPAAERLRLLAEGGPQPRPRLPELESVPEGTPITVSLSRAGTSSGTSTTASCSLRPTAAQLRVAPSDKGYSTQTRLNPNSVQCLNTATTTA